MVLDSDCFGLCIVIVIIWSNEWNCVGFYFIEFKSGVWGVKVCIIDKVLVCSRYDWLFVG